MASARHVGKQDDSRRCQLAREVGKVCQTRGRPDIRDSREYQFMKTIAGHVRALHRPTTTNRKPSLELIT